MNIPGLQTIQENFGPPSVCTQPNKIIINVGGTRFETYKSTLKNIPDTRLAWITESKADNPDFDPASGEYFFDRHPSMFLMILNYYRTGKLHTPSDVCGPAFEEELTFWGIDEKQIESCCWGGYSQHRDAQKTLEELRIDTNNEADDVDMDDAQFGSTAEKFGITECEMESRSNWQQIKPKIWSVVDGHTVSWAAKVFTAVSLSVTIVGITAFILETDATCRVMRNISDPYPQNYTQREFRQKTKPHPVLIYIEIVCMIALTIETLLRFISCPVKKTFVKHPLNVFDMVALLSFYITSALHIANGGFVDDINVYLQLLRLFRVFRIFKVATHLPALKILLHTLKASATELTLMIMLTCSLVICFASVIYYAEQISDPISNDFESIPIGFWWAIVTMTTLGYGDKRPQTAPGYLIGSICALCGVLFIALPIPIIVNNFSIYYTHAKAQEKLPKKKKVALVGAADALKQVLTNSTPLESKSDINSETSSQCSQASNPIIVEESRVDQNVKPDRPELVKRASKNTSNGSVYSSERTTGGISVTFTDVDDGDNNFKMHFPQSTPHQQNGKSPPGGLFPCKEMYPNIDEDDENSDNLLRIENPDMIKRKKATPITAMSRRASLLPGGVSNQSPAPSHQKLSIPQKTPGARERRRSLMPATYGGG